MLHGTDRFRSLDSKKRSVVLDAAAEEFATYGYLAASTNRIAAAAKISKGALFSYFPTKEMLFGGVVGSLFEHVLSDSPELAAAPPESTLSAELALLAGRLFALHQRWPRLFRLGIELTLQGAHVPDVSAHVEHYHSLLDAHVAAAVARAGSQSKLAVDPVVAAQLAGAAFDRLRTMLVLRAPEAVDRDRFDKLAVAMTDALARAIAR